MDLQIGGITIIALVIGIVEAAKEYGVTGQWSKLLALILAAVFGGIALGIEEALIPAAWLTYIIIGVKVLAYTLAANGWYDLAAKRLFKK